MAMWWNSSSARDLSAMLRPMRVALVALLVCVPGSINLSITLLPLLLACAMLLNPPVRRRPTLRSDDSRTRR